MRPDFRIIADGADITALIADRLLRLSVSDKAGVQSDTAEIEIDDRGYRVDLPAVGAELDIAMGAVGTGLTAMGVFVVDEVSGKGPEASMLITAKAADMNGALRAPRTRAWEDMSLSAIVGAIARRHGLAPRVAPVLADTRFAYLAQTAESDLNFLTRIARDLDATAKPAGRALVVVRRGAGETATGEALAPVEIPARIMEHWTWQLTSRGRSASVTALWSETAAGVVHRETVGAGDPGLELRHRHATAAEARRAAQAELDRGARGSGQLRVTLAGFRGSIMAEGIVRIVDIKPELCGEWTVESVRHELGGDRLATSFTAERDINQGNGGNGGSA